MIDMSYEWLKNNNKWIRDLVDFYDFIFERAANKCVKCVNKELIENWEDGNQMYEKMITVIEKEFPFFENALSAFLNNKGIE